MYDRKITLVCDIAEGVYYNGVLLVCKYLHVNMISSCPNRHIGVLCLNNIVLLLFIFSFACILCVLS